VFKNFRSKNAIFLKIDFDLILILSIPFILLAANNEWLFPYGNPTDAWNNTNYFFDTGNDYPTLYTLYKATRLSWILKGLLVNTLFPPLTAYYILHLTIFSIYLAAFYLIVKNLFNRHIAFISTVAFGTYSQFHAVISYEWNYQTHDGVANILLTLLFLLLAAKSLRWRIWLMLAGAAWASALQTTYMGTYILVVPFWYLYLNQKYERHPIGASIVYVALGGLAATLLYCIASYLLGGPFLFFMTMIDPILGFGFVGGFAFTPGYWFPFEYQLQYSKGLVIPLYGIVISTAVMAMVLIKRPKGRAINGIVVTLVCFMIAFASHVAFHLLGHGHLSNDHMLVYITPFVFLAIAGVYGYFLRVSGITVPANSAMAGALKIAVLVVFCATLILGLDVQAATGFITRSAQDLLGLPARWQSWQSISGLTLLVIFSSAALVLGIFFVRLRRARYAVPVICLSGFLALANVQTASIAIASYDWNFRCGFHKDQYQAVIDTFLKLRKFDPNYDLRIWYRNNEIAPHPDSRCSQMNLSSIYGKPVINMSELYGAVWGARLFSVIDVPGRPAAYDYDGLIERYQATASFAEFSKRRLSRLPPVFRAAILSGDPRDHDTALNTLRSHGLKPIILDRTHIQRGAISFDVTILEVKKDDRLKAQSRR